MVLEVDGAGRGASAIDHGGVLRDVLLWRDGGDELVIAPRARVAFSEGTLDVAIEEGESHLSLAGGYVRTHFETMRTELPVPLVDARGKEPFELTPGELLRTLRVRRETGKEVRFHRLALHRRVAGALAVPLLVLLAWPLGRSREGGGAARGVLLAVAIGLTYYLLLRVADHGLRELHWPPLVAAYAGAAALAVAAALGWRWRWRP